jgi:hypothetical protein
MSAMPEGTADLFIENRIFDELTVGETANLSHPMARAGLV